MKERIVGSNGAVLLARGEDCRVYQFCNDTGEGTMVFYDIFPGVMLSMNDFHMDYYDSRFVSESDVFAVDHCQKGRMECPAGEDAYIYAAPGDLKLDRRLTHTGRFAMPMKYYCGATVMIDLELAQTGIQREMQSFNTDLMALRKKFCPEIYPCVLRGQTQIDRIVTGIYAAPVKGRLPYVRVKVLELLLCLDALESPKNAGKVSCYYRSHAEKAKAIQQFLIEHLDENHTQEALSERFGIPLSSMKQCFKSVYGSTISEWLLEYRMDRAATLLAQDRRLGIAKVATMVGYASPSKFAMAFRRATGFSPTEYRGRMLK